jgi:hypothetical protein
MLQLSPVAPNFMGLASLGLEIGIFCDFLCSVLLLSVVLGLDLLGLALSRPLRLTYTAIAQSSSLWVTITFESPIPMVR